jgi:Tol biopolymer transport system component
MTEQPRIPAVDSVLRRLDVPATPDEAFLRSSSTLLALRAERARSQDRSLLGRLRRDLRWTTAASHPIPRTPAIALLGLMVSLLLLGLLLILASGRPHRPPPFGLADNGRVAFVKGDHIFTADALGGDVRQVTFGDGAQTDPRYSPDGEHLVYRQWDPASPDEHETTHDAVVAAADGSNPVVVARGIFEMSHVSWSPDSGWVAFSGSPDGRQPSALYVVAADGSAGPKAIGAFGGSAWDPTWAPDGNRLVVSSDAGLWVVNRDGSNARIVTHDRYKEIGSRGESAEWSPDGRQILFTAVFATDRQDVYLVLLDGTPERMVSGDADRARDATFSPDGSQIAYMRNGTGSGPKCVIANADGRTVRVLPGAYGWYQPMWSPDGTKVVVTDDLPGQDNDGALPAVRVILDVVGSQPAIEIPAPGTTGDSIPDWAASWQRVAP